MIGDKKKDEKAAKRPDVQPVIVSFKPQGMPTPMGGVQLMIFGLGEDSLVYAWDSTERCWFFV